MFDIYQGDPALSLTPDGADIEFVEGQPVMDQGLQNAALIAPMTEAGWCGNAIAPTAEAIGSTFMSETRRPITRSQMDLIAKAGKAAMADKAFGDVTVEITNPTGAQISALFRISPPTQDVQTLLLSGVGANWQGQALNPAHERSTA